ncbi:MAG: hypothetical protein MZU84_03550 [Sphingobacterium sp.]|nr:hypothetical protein [Sphingobacterium sp.]
MKIELEYLEKLAKLVSDYELTELSLEEGEKAVVIRKEKEVITTQVASVMPQAMPVQAAAPVAMPVSAPKPEAKAESPKGVPITSPMVGTFYRASTPGISLSPKWAKQ